MKAANPPAWCIYELVSAVLLKVELGGRVATHQPDFCVGVGIGAGWHLWTGMVVGGCWYWMLDAGCWMLDAGVTGLC